MGANVILGVAIFSFLHATSVMAADEKAQTNATLDQAEQMPSAPMGTLQQQQSKQGSPSLLSMRCAESDSGHRISIWVSNDEGRNLKCTATCDYKTQEGPGTLTHTGIVPAKVKNVLFISESTCSLKYWDVRARSIHCSSE